MIKRFFSLWLAVIAAAGVIAQDMQPELPKAVSSFIQTINWQALAGQKPIVKFDMVSSKMMKASFSWILKDTIRQDDWRVDIFPGFKPGFHWAPHLTPTKDHIIAQHVFRSPALVMASAEKQITLIPDLDVLKRNGQMEWYMDLDAQNNIMHIGLSKSKVKEHVSFIREKGAKYSPGKLEFGFYILIEDDKTSLHNPWRKTLEFLWTKWGQSEYERSRSSTTRHLEPFVVQTYNWAFNSWKDVVWQEFELNGKKVGAPQFIVNVTQSPNYPGEVNEREFRSIWNQAWFSSLRSAQGLYRYAKRTGNKNLLQHSLMTKELALSFPQTKGFFPGLIATEMEQLQKDGKVYNRSKGWGTYYFGNSDRNPYEREAKKSPLHILDMSFTAFLMLTWFDELEKDQRLLSYASEYADALLKLQDVDGFFPAWLSQDNYSPLPHLKQSPETSMSVTFLLKLYSITGKDIYRQSALRAMNAVMEKVIPFGQWEDFETYWSCSRYGKDSLVGKKVVRNNMFKQNTFSMYWTAEALLICFKLTNDAKYLAFGRRTLDEMLMSQASWQPPYIYVDAIGGFGVMNFDGEWNDARQSIFSELILDYAKQFDSREYIQRGLSALRASFLMIYSPDNPKTKKQWEHKWNFFGPKDYGFMMENYGHGGVTSPQGVGIGEFTIYDWGNGAAAEAYNRIVDHYGKEFIERN
ncbi:MAG TPA: hypothetical protein VFN95_16615 [Flavitalea sp.]|nr:hypothetical protein [Flavitalea sp.]